MPTRRYLALSKLKKVQRVDIKTFINQLKVLGLVGYGELVVEGVCVCFYFSQISCQFAAKCCTVPSSFAPNIVDFFGVSPLTQLEKKA